MNLLYGAPKDLPRYLTQSAVLEGYPDRECFQPAPSKSPIPRACRRCKQCLKQKDRPEEKKREITAHTIREDLLFELNLIEDRNRRIKRLGGYLEYIIPLARATWFQDDGEPQDALMEASQKAVEETANKEYVRFANIQDATRYVYRIYRSRFADFSNNTKRWRGLLDDYGRQADLFHQKPTNPEGKYWERNQAAKHWEEKGKTVTQKREEIEQKALSHLSEMERTVWLLVKKVKLNHKETAALLGIKHDNARQIYHRANQRFRKFKRRYRKEFLEEFSDLYG